MRTLRMATPIATMILVLAAAAPQAATLSGSVTAGNVFVDEVGDLSAVQETYDLEEGFALSRILLNGTGGPRNSFVLDLRDINLRSRAGNFAFRAPGRFRLTAGYDQNRYVFDPGRGITSERKDWRAGLRLTPGKWLALSGDFNQQTREGERLSYPLGTASALGGRYDNTFLTGSLTADVRAGRSGGGVSVRMTDYSDELNAAADRTGQVVSGRLYAPMPFSSRWLNLLRGSYGTRKVTDGDVEYKLSGFQYTSVLQPRDEFELRYAFDATRVEDDALELQTDRFQNDLDLTLNHAYGRASVGYGYEMNDDDRTLTTYHSWRAGMTFRPSPRLLARADYAGRIKLDQEELTLLKDVESARVRGRLEVRPWNALTVGGDFAIREREFPDIGVSVDGVVTGGFARYDVPAWGALSADYSHTKDEYVDLLAGFRTASDVVTARVEINRIKNLRVAGGLTYMDISRDLDIEKSMGFVEAALRLAGRYRLEAKYNVYNYDDYILLDRYYTANVVRVDLGYDLIP